MSKYSNKLLLLNFLMLLFIGCKYQSQDLINTKLTIDKENNNGEFYSSKKLDELFVIKGYTYFEPDNVGTSFDNFYIKNIIQQWFPTCYVLSSTFVIFDCCKQSFTRLYHPSIFPSIHPSILPFFHPVP